MNHIYVSDIFLYPDGTFINMNKLESTFLIRKLTLGDLEVSVFNNKPNINKSIFVSSVWDIFSHFHFFYEIHFINGADVRYFIRDTPRELKEGYFCVFPPRYSHSPEMKYDGIKHYVFQFDLRQGTGGRSDFSEYRYYSELFGRIAENGVFPISGFMMECAEKIEALQNSEDPANKHKTEMLLGAFFCEIGGIISKTELGAAENDDDKHGGLPSFDDENTRRKLIIEQMVNDRYLAGLTYEDLMRELSLSRRQCVRIVTSLTGMTLHDLITKQRIGRALELMKKTDVPLDEIAYSVGYSSYTGFYLAFKKWYGITPQEYRREIRTTS